MVFKSAAIAAIVAAFSSQQAVLAAADRSGASLPSAAEAPSLCVRNDNFCDCGDDEPETSACSFYSSARFQCKSTVYNMTVPLSQVDDGICDCCDGSDETIGCTNKCQGLADTVRVEEERLESIKRAGKMAVAKLAAEAQSRLAGVRKDAESAREAVQSMEALVTSLREEQRVARDKENEESNKYDEEIRKLDAQAVDTIKMLVPRRLLIDVLSHAALRLDKDVLEVLLIEISRNKEQSGISADDAAAIATFEESRAASSAAVSGEVGADGSTTANALDASPARSTGPLEERMADNLSLSRFSDEFLVKLVFSLFDKFEAGCKDKTIFDKLSSTDPAMSHVCRVIDVYKSNKAFAKGVLESMISATRALQDRISETESLMRAERRKITEADEVERDFGPDNVLFTFWGQCYTTYHDKYNYKICPFKEAKQDHVTLGRFAKWEYNSDGAMVFKYEEGQKCFGIRDREMTLTLRCASGETKLAEVSEPETCVYKGVLDTPVAC
jgi:protein kinase C substrate 80K-H